MLQIAKTSLVLKRQLRKDHEKIQPVDTNPIVENLAKYQIFSPKTLHKLLYLENSTWSDTMVPLCKTVFGALLFADISGFTRLSAHLSAEELKFHINQYFSLLLGGVYQHYGDIIKFCGDAIIVMWPIAEDSNELVQQAAVELAIKCSLHLIQVCGQYDHKYENGSPVSLRLHCGVGCGKIHCMCLGDNDRWEFLIAGDALTQVGAATADAGIGEVCVSSEAFSFVSQVYPTSAMLPSGNYQLDSQSVEDTHHEDDISPNATGPFKNPHLSVNTSSQSQIQSPNPHTARSKLSTRFSLFPTSHRYQTTSEDSVADNQHRTDSDELKSQFSLSFSIHLNNSKSQGTSSISIPSPIDGGPGSSHRRNPSIPAAGRRNSFAVLLNQVALAVSGANASSQGGSIGPSFDGSTQRTGKLKGISCRENSRFLDVIYFLSLPSFLTPGNEINIPPPSPSSQRHVDTLQNIAIITKFAQFIRLFVPEAARTAIEHRSLSYLAELRVVVTAFIQILGVEDDLRNGRIERPQLVISIVLSCLKRYGGSLRQYLVDDKGCVVILAFGLPGSSHEDNSIRAIETTARIRHLLNSNTIDCKIGITQGRVYCGMVGSNERCEYAMMGSSVNLAARFMSQAAINTIIVSHEIYTQSSQEYEYKTLPKMKAKGYLKPVAAYIPLHRLNNGTSHGGKIGENIENRDGFRFVGRESELSILTTAFDTFSHHGGRSLFTITGAPGVGKTWLLSKFLQYTSTTFCISNYSIHADEYHSNSKYFCLRQLLDQIFAHEEMSSPSQTTTTNILHNFSSTMTSIKGGGGGGGGGDVKSRHRHQSHTGSTSTKEKRVLGHSYSAVCAGSGGGYDESTFQYEYKLYTWITKHASTLRLKDLDIDETVFIELSKSDLNVEGIIPSQSPLPPSATAAAAASQQQQQQDQLRPFSQHEIINDVFASNNHPYSGETLMSDAVNCLDCILPIQSRKIETTLISQWARMKICIGIILKILQICLLNQDTILTIENLHWCDGPSLEIIMKLLLDATTCFTIATLRTLSIEPNSRHVRKNSDSLLINSHHIIEKLRENERVGAVGLGAVGGIGGVGLGLGGSSTGGSGTSHGLGSLTNLHYDINKYAIQYIQLSRSCAVHPLSPLEIKTMIEDVISERLCQTYPDILKINTLSQILMRTGGSPYLVSAFILSLRDSLLNGTFKGIDSLPSGEHNIIVNRFDKLTLTQQLILKVASVIGNEFTCDFLSNVLMNIGHDMSSSVSGLELTLEKLLTTTLITISDDYYSTSLFTSTNSQLQHFIPIISSESNHIGDDEVRYISSGGGGPGGGGGGPGGGVSISNNNNKTSTKLFKFTTKTVQECIYNLMLKSQKDASHNAVAIVMENLCGVLPVLYFDEIAKHVYASNNIPKKILYLEESLRRAIYQDDINTMKDTLQRLFLIATGLTPEGILNHCCRINNIEEMGQSSQDPHLHLSNYPKLEKTKKLKKLNIDTPVTSIWLLQSDIRREIPILPSISIQTLPYTSTPKVDPFHSISTKSLQPIESSKPIPSDDMVIPGGTGSGTAGGTGTGTGTGTQSSRSGNVKISTFTLSSTLHSRLLEEEDIFLWLFKLAEVHFRLGNFKLANNFIILGLQSFKITAIPVDILDDVHDYYYRLKMWYTNLFHRLPKSLTEQAISEIINSYILLTQIYLLRGYTATSHACLQRAISIQTMTTSSSSSSSAAAASASSPSSHFAIEDERNSFSQLNHRHIHGLSALFQLIHNHTPVDTILSSFQESSDDINHEIGMNYIYKALIEFASCHIQNAFHSINYAMSFYDQTESVVVCYICYILQGWFNIFSGNSLESQRLSELAYQHANSNLIPSTLLKWTIEIKIVSKIYSLNFNDAYVEWEKLKGYSKRDSHSATSSAIASFILIHLKGYDTAFIHCKYALLRLIKKPQTTPISSLFLFFTIYSSLKIIDHCKMLTDPSYSSRRVTSTSNQLLGWDIMTSKISVERAKTAIKILTPSIFDGMKAMRSAMNTFPIVTVLYYTLLILQVRTGVEQVNFFHCHHSTQKIDFELMKLQLDKYQSFKFGMAYYHHEKSLTLLEYGEKYHGQAQQAEDLSMRLFRDSQMTGNIGSVRFVNQRNNMNGTSFRQGNNNFTKESEDSKEEEEDDESTNDKFILEPVDPYENLRQKDRDRDREEKEQERERDRDRVREREEQEEQRSYEKRNQSLHEEEEHPHSPHSPHTTHSRSPHSQSPQRLKLSFSSSSSSSTSSSGKREYLTDGIHSTPITPTEEISFIHAIAQGKLEDLIEESVTNLSNIIE